eukprot:6391510-Amphidinium_carterae.1
MHGCLELDGAMYKLSHQRKQNRRYACSLSIFISSPFTAPLFQESMRKDKVGGESARRSSGSQ